MDGCGGGVSGWVGARVGRCGRERAVGANVGVGGWVVVAVLVVVGWRLRWMGWGALPINQQEHGMAWDARHEAATCT